MNRTFRVAIATFAVASFFLLVLSTGHADESARFKIAKATEIQNISKQEDFLKIENGSFVILYEPDVKLKKVYGKLRRRRFRVNGKWVKADGSSDPEDKVNRRVEMLLARVQEILDMHPSNVYFTIKIYKDQKSVHDKYREITGTRKKIKAFHDTKYHTIHISEDDISDSVLSHEIAHVVTDKHLMIRPTRDAREKLAIYVDTNLDRRRLAPYPKIYNGVGQDSLMCLTYTQKVSK